MLENGNRSQNQIVKFIVGNQEYTGSQAIGQGLVEHFCTFSKKGKRNRWIWCDRGARVMTQDQQMNLVWPFSEEEVRAKIKELNGEGSPGRRHSGVLL